MRFRMLAGLALSSTIAFSQTPGPQLLGAQATFIQQWLRPFDDPYEGTNSLSGKGDAALTDTYGVYTGTGLWSGGELYLDVEMARGRGVSHSARLKSLAVNLIRPRCHPRA